MNTVLDGRYQIVKKLGRGGFAYTYLARNISLPDRPTCVIKHLRPKVLHPSVLHLFKREARVLGRLDHQQIPRSSEYFERHGEVFMVQDFIDGEDLGKQYLRGKMWSEQEMRVLLEDLLEVLDYVHQNQIVHRDVKPENIIQRQPDGQYVLIDFGAVEEIGSTMAEEMEVDQGKLPILGTAGYRSPEQLRGKILFSNDLYSLGMTAIHLLTRIHPNCLEQRYGQPLWREHASVSPELAAAIDKMICPDLAERYTTATMALADLRSLPAVLVEESQLEETHYPARRRRVWLAVLGALGIASATWGVDRHLGNSATPQLPEESLHL
jgi:eukaryotic-like serine/threonine-protein kinase